MATAMNAFPEIERAPRKERASKYPWSDWTDGQVWELTPGEDFTCAPNSLRAQAKLRADALDLKVHRRQALDGTLYLQFVPREASTNGTAESE